MKDNKHRLIIWLLTFVIWICSLDIKIMIHDNHQLILEQLSWVKTDIKEFKQESDERQVNLYMEMQERFDEVEQCKEFLNHK